MDTNKQIKRALRFAKPVLMDRFGKSETQTMLSQMRDSYANIEVPHLKNGINQMLLRIAVDTVLFYRVLPDDLSPSQKHKLVEAFANNWMDGQFEGWLTRKVFSSRRLHLLLRQRWIRGVNRADEADGWHYEFIPPQGELYYGMNTYRCGIVNFLAEQGLPELGPILCSCDFRAQKHLPKGIVFKRTQILAEGAPLCDFRYYLVS